MAPNSARLQRLGIENAPCNPADSATFEIDWKRILSKSIVTTDALAGRLPVDGGAVKRVIDRYPMRINPYFLSLIRRPEDPIWKQAVPSSAELDDASAEEDLLAEEVQSPVMNLIHRYPRRVLFMVSDQCALYCRHCLRKRKVGRPFVVTDETIRKGIDYIRRRDDVREVILSGGDPLVLDDHALLQILEDLRAIPHVEIIRIHTRAPCTLPQRVTGYLASELARHHPLYINVQFNHPDEITKEASQACTRLADAGIPLGCQTVLLKGVNDDASCMRRLFQALIKIRVRPYYLHHLDRVRGTGHFATSINKGLRIMETLHGRLSGLCLPQYMLDLPGGSGKVPMTPEHILQRSDQTWWIQNGQGKIRVYSDIE